MSFDIGSVGRTPPVAPTTTTRASSGTAETQTAAVAVTVDTIPATPPPEVHDAIGVANRAYHDLQASGNELRFKVNEATGKLTVEVHDTHGNVMFTIPSHKVLDIAEGGSLQ
jgi:uncharacterized FlaG/YvyC family protein